MRPRRNAGFSMIELLLGLSLVGILMIPVVQTFLTQNRHYILQDQTAAREDNLRAAMTRIVDALRVARYASPKSFLDDWFSWVPTFQNNPQIYDGGSNPDSFAVAACFRTVGTLKTATTGGASVLKVTPVAGETLGSVLDDQQKSVISVGGVANAGITKVVGTDELQIDANPPQKKVQKLLTGSYPIGTPICRVDVLTFKVANDRLLVNDDPVAEGIENLQIEQIHPERYKVTLTARTEKLTPGSTNYLERTEVTYVTVRNDRI